jgi:hypothetical protein
MTSRPFLKVAVAFAIVPVAAFATTGDELFSGLSAQERSWVEESCPRSLGPSIYLSCVQREVSSLRSGIPDITSLSHGQQDWIRQSCPPSLGPSVYASCVEREMSALRGGEISLDSLDPDTRRWVEESCPRSLGPSVYTSCVQRELGALGMKAAENSTQVTKHAEQPKASQHAEPVAKSDLPVRRHSKSPTRPNPPQSVDTVATSGHALWQEATPFVILFTILFVLFAPIVWVLASSRSHGGAKFGWLIVALLFSWLGLAVFLIATQATRNRE